MTNEQTLKFNLTIAQTNTILAALAKQPLEAVLDLFNSIKEQAAPQLVQPRLVQPAEQVDEIPAE